MLSCVPNAFVLLSALNLFVLVTVYDQALICSRPLVILYVMMFPS